jgi:ATP-dependent helicase HrpA
VANGICIRLYDEQDFAAGPRFTDPEILRSSLAGVILRMKSLHLGDSGGRLPLHRAAPAARRLPTVMLLLQRAGAVDDANELTDVGQNWPACRSTRAWAA